MDVSDIINKIYRLPQTSLDTLIDSVSEVEYPKNFHLHRENKKETKSYFNVSSTKIINRESVDYRTPVRD